MQWRAVLRAGLRRCGISAGGRRGAAASRRSAGGVDRRLAQLRKAAAGTFVTLTTLLCTASAALAAPTGSSGASGGPAPGADALGALTGWIKQYGWAGAPLAISLGGLLMTVEHHQQRTGNAIRAKGYIFAAGAGLIVISLAGAGTSALHTLVSNVNH